MGVPCTFAVPRRPGVKPDNEAVREALADKPPLVLFGSYNERMYLGRSRAPRGLHPRVVPGRHHPAPHRHALHGLLRARPTSSRKSATPSSTRSSTSCRSRPTSTGSSRPRRGMHARARPGTRRRKALLDELVERIPFLVRISAAKRLRDARRAGAARRRRGPGDGRARERACSRQDWPREAQPRDDRGSARTGGRRQQSITGELTMECVTSPWRALRTRRAGSPAFCSRSLRRLPHAAAVAARCSRR